MEIIYNSNLEIVKQNAQESINQFLLSDSTKPILFLVSGGSALDLLNNFEFRLNPNITITVLDERADTNPKINNFSQLEKTDFFAQAESAGCKFINTQLLENETPVELAERFESELRKWKQENPNGIIIATIGIGSDGHTSGIPPMPNNEDGFNKLFNSDRWVQDFNAEELGWDNPYKKRVTTTITFLRLIDYGIGYAVGENKKEVLINLKSNIPVHKLPASVLKEMGNINIFTNLEI